MWAPNQVLLTTTPLNSPPYTLNIKNIQSLLGAPITTTNLVNASGNTYPQNLALWLRADQGVSTNSDGTVNNWNDQSGNGNTFTGTGGFEPAYVGNAVNGLPALLFNATNETYLYSTTTGGSLAIVNDMTVFAVMNFTTYADPSGVLASTGGGEILSKTDPNNPNQPASYDYYVYYNSPNDPYFLRGNGTTGGSFVGAGASPSTGVWHEMSAMMTPLVAGAATIYHRLDGRQTGVIAWTGPTPADTGGSAFIGTRPDGAVRLTGYMAELIVVGSALNTNDVDTIETYLGNKYGIITSAPLGIQATNSSSAVVYWQNPVWYNVLQSTPTVKPAVWTTVTTAPTLVNNTNAVSVPTTNQMYFRLKSASQ